MQAKPEIRNPKAECLIQRRVSGPCRRLGEASSELGFRPSFGLRPSAFGLHPRSAFTLIELILVMAILTMSVSVTAPTLANFFRGRTLDSEARRLVALTHIGQNRAVSEGIPMDLWVDPANGMVGLDAEPSYETEDAKAVEFAVDSGVHIQIGKQTTVTPAVPTLSRGQVATIASVPRSNLTHPNLPTIRFLPDGTIGENSPQMLQIIARDGTSLWVALTKDKTNYEIRRTDR